MLTGNGSLAFSQIGDLLELADFLAFQFNDGPQHRICRIKGLNAWKIDVELAAIESKGNGPIIGLIRSKESMADWLCGQRQDVLIDGDNVSVGGKQGKDNLVDVAEVLVVQVIEDFIPEVGF